MEGWTCAISPQTPVRLTTLFKRHETKTRHRVFFFKPAIDAEFRAIFRKVKRRNYIHVALTAYCNQNRHIFEPYANFLRVHPTRSLKVSAICHPVKRDMNEKQGRNVIYFSEIQRFTWIALWDLFQVFCWNRVWFWPKWGVPFLLNFYWVSKKALGWNCDRHSRLILFWHCKKGSFDKCDLIPAPPTLLTFFFHIHRLLPFFFGL